MELRTENLVVGYDKHPLIKNVNLRVKSGEVLTLIGTKWSRKIYNIKNNNKAAENIGRCGVYRRYIHEQYAGQ